MQNGKKLIELISTLSKSERIYFKKFAFIHHRGKKSNYLQLFDLIQKKHVYEDVKFGIKNLPSIKHYLYKFILRSLRSYYHNTNPAIEVKNLLVDINILFQRGLFAQCQSLISSTKKVILKSNLYVEYLSILKAEYALLLTTEASICSLKENAIEQEKITRYLISSIESLGHSVDLSQVSSSSKSVINRTVITQDLFQLTKEKPAFYPIGYN